MIREVNMRRRWAVAALIAVASMTLPMQAAQKKMTPEELVRLHLQALTTGTMPPPEQGRDVKGAVSATTPARAAGVLPGTFRLTTGATSSRLTLRFDTDKYE